MQNQRRYAAILLAALAAGMLTAGCGKKTPAAPVAEQDTEYSLVIEDTPVSAPEETTLPVLSDTTAAPAEMTTAPQSARTETTSAGTTSAAYLLTDDTLEWNTEITVEATVDRDGIYTTKDDVALYIYTYGELPDNFITKKEAQKLGWEGGSLEPYAPGKCIGGSYFGNYEGKLPEKDGREYTECDIDTLGKRSRGAKRIVFSNDGLIYYTDDHYNTFELLYGEE